MLIFGGGVVTPKLIEPQKIRALEFEVRLLLVWLARVTSKDNWQRLLGMDYIATLSHADT